MIHNAVFPKVLIIGIERINATDSSNNGLLLRKLFEKWPREKTAQIFSYSNNNDSGFFGKYYKIGTKERLFGTIFFKLKQYDLPNKKIIIEPVQSTHNNIVYSLKKKIKELFIETGLFEFIFRPKLSNELKTWIEAFNPEVIFVQGYGLYYLWLLLKIKKHSNAKVAFLTTDDWPTYLYAGLNGERKFLKWLIRPKVCQLTNKMFSIVDVPFAFHLPMKYEYEKRYKMEFITLSHSDDLKRFENISPIRYHEEDVLSILIAGYFNKNRLPLLKDVNDTCRLLDEKKINARVIVIYSGIDNDRENFIDQLEYIDFLPDPGNDLLPQYLIGADINLLLEDFDDNRALAIRLSVSSKAHLFMFSKKPIIVYANENTGVLKYAEEFGWAAIVKKRGSVNLMEQIIKITTDKDFTSNLILNAETTVNKFHLIDTNQEIFVKSLTKTT